MTSSKISLTFFTTVAIAALAYIAACVAHEVVGHGVACLAAGGRITLLTSVYFQCENGGVVTDFAGPLMNLLLGLGAYVLLHKRTWSSNMALALVLTLALNLFWLAGCMLTSAVTHKSDFAYALRLLAINPPWLGQLSLGAAGLLVYWFGLRATSKHVTRDTPLIVSYFVSGVVSCVAALFFVGSVIPAVQEAALESFGSAVGLLLLANRQSHRFAPTTPDILPASGHGWLGAGVLATLVFFLLLGRGLVVLVNI